MSDFFKFEMSQQKSIRYDGVSLYPGDLVHQPNPHMPLLDAIYTRRTSRSYAAEKVPADLFEWIIEGAMQAPTACNEQRWKIVYIDDKEIIKDLYLRGSASFLKNIQQCFILCYNNQTDNDEWLDHIQSGAAFINTFSLLSHSVGVGSCWVGHLPNKSELRRIFKIHSNYDPVALIAFGYYQSKTKMTPRKKEPSSIIFHNSFKNAHLNFNTERGVFLRKVMRYIYYKIPAFIRIHLKKYTTKYEKKFYYEKFD